MARAFGYCTGEAERNLEPGSARGEPGGRRQIEGEKRGNKKEGQWSCEILGKDRKKKVEKGEKEQQQKPSCQARSSEEYVRPYVRLE